MSNILALFIFVPTVTCVLLALQWGSSIYPWNNGRIIALFVLFGVLAITFIAFEYWKGTEATLPIHIITQRSVAAAAWNAFCNGGAFFLLIYYIPIWQQIIRNATAASSGIARLPFILGVVIMATLVGVLVTRIGYCSPFMLLASAITPIGEGLIATWTVNTPFSHWVGYQALAGLGIGMGQQQPQVVIQAVLPKADILQVSTVGTTQLRSLVSPQDLHKVLVAYNSALARVFMVAVVMSVLTVFGSLSAEWKSIKPTKKQQQS